MKLNDSQRAQYNFLIHNDKEYKSKSFVIIKEGDLYECTIGHHTSFFWSGYSVRKKSERTMIVGKINHKLTKELDDKNFLVIRIYARDKGIFQAIYNKDNLIFLKQDHGLSKAL